jgi:hypothetical protein
MRSCQQSLKLSSDIQWYPGRPRDRPGYRPNAYFFLGGAGGAAPVSWWKTTTHFPLRSVHTVDA